MRKIDKSSVAQPIHTQYSNRTFQDKVNTAIEEKDATSKNREFKGYDTDAIKNALKVLYPDKCAYCESNSEVVASLQVEHYRPKKKVTEEVSHRGYYWLAWEWTNLVYACARCNQGGTGKGFKFPIAGTRCTEEPKLNNELDYEQFNASHATLTGEQPLLLHPEIDNPEEHLTCEIDGKLRGLTTRGTRTIEICGLNRSPLIKARFTVLCDTRNVLGLVMLAYNNKPDALAKEYLKQVLDMIFRYDEKVETYTFFRNWIRHNAEIALFPQIPAEFQATLRQAIAKYHKNEW